MKKKFQKKVEDFVCENCGHKVKGTGYTDHCPECLCSKHVDINPGDRAANCGGIMRVINIEYRHGDYDLIYQCDKCKQVTRNKRQEEDNMDNLIAAQKEINKSLVKK